MCFRKLRLHTMTKRLQCGPPPTVTTSTQRARLAMPAHMARTARTSRCGGLDASSGSRGSETTLWRCAALVGQWLVTNLLPHVGGVRFHDDERAARE